MSQEEQQSQQRQANFDALRELGVDQFPHRFDRTHSVHAITTELGELTGEDLEAKKPEVITAGRILSIRAFGKANFVVISDGKARVQIYIRQDALSERDFKLYKLLDFGDHIGVSGRVFRTKTNELTIWASSLTFLAKCFLPLPEKWHGLQDIETRYRPALSRSHCESGLETRIRSAQPRAARDPALPRRARLPRGRDADDAADSGRRARAAVHHASQHARHVALPAHCAGAVPQAAHGRRHGSRLRDQPELSQRGDLHAAQPRVHDAGVLPGVHRVSGADGDDRGDDRLCRAGGDRHRYRAVRRAHDLAEAAISAAVDARCRPRARVGAPRHHHHRRRPAIP